MNEPRDHHYVPQFYLRNFSNDPERKKIFTVTKNGEYAVWGERSIEQLGYERDFYMHTRQGVPVSVESDINKRVENPISKSDTWKKIVAGATQDLDHSDKPMLYALMRHLEVRTPHYFNTVRELAELAASSSDKVLFNDEEREVYAFLHNNPDEAKLRFNFMSSTLEWTERNYRGAAMSVCRSPLPLTSSTTPVLTMKISPHPARWLPFPGMTPFQLIFTPNRNTIVTLVFADFDDVFTNDEISADVARGFNRQFVGQSSFFGHIKHLISNKDGLVSEMDWAQHDLISENDNKIVFRRRSK